MTQKSYRQNLLIGALMIAVIISPLIIDLLSVNDYVAQLRLDFFAVPYVYALGWAIILRQKENLLKNIALILMMIAVYYAGLQAFRDQKVKYFDWQREMKVFDDIRARIKADPAFSPNGFYHVFVLDGLDAPSKVTPFDHYNKKMEWENSWVPFVTIWNIKDFLDFYEKNTFVVWFALTSDFELPDEELKNMDFDYLMNRARPWPHRDGVYVQPGRIYIILDEKALDTIKDRIISRGYMKQKDVMISH